MNITLIKSLLLHAYLEETFLIYRFLIKKQYNFNEFHFIKLHVF
jgi:hypothetical protein